MTLEFRRFRDLSRRDAVLVAGVFGLVALPVIVSLAHALGGLGSEAARSVGDVAYLALRSRDVLFGPLPLIGNQSSVEASNLVMQPGPIQVVLEAPFVGVLGADVGPPVFAGAVSLGASWCVLVAVFRRFGVVATPIAAWVVLLVQAELGLHALVDSISSTLGQLPLVAAFVLVAMVVAGDRHLFPLAAFATSFVIQIHLSLVGYAMALVPLLCVVVVAVLVEAARGRRSDVGWVAAAAGLSLLMWLPPFVDQVTGTGNLGRIVRTGSGEGVAQAAQAGSRELASALSSVVGPSPALLSPPDAALVVFPYQRSNWLVVAGLLGLLAVTMAGVAWSASALRRTSGDAEARSRRTAAGVMALTAVAMVCVGVFFRSKVRGAAMLKPNNSRWVVIGGALVWLAVALLVLTVPWVVERVRQGGTDGRGSVLRRVVLAGPGLAALVVALGVARQPHVESLDSAWQDAAPGIGDAIDEAWPPDEPVRLRGIGVMAAGAVQPAVVLDLETRGRQVRVVDGFDSLRAGYGEHRLSDTEGAPYIDLLGGGIAPALPYGRVLDVVYPRPVATTQSSAAWAIECLDLARPLIEGTEVTERGARFAAGASRHRDLNDGLMAAGLADPRFLWLSGRGPAAVRRGLVTAPDEEGCPDAVREAGASMLYIAVLRYE